MCVLFQQQHFVELPMLLYYNIRLDYHLAFERPTSSPPQTSFPCYTSAIIDRTIFHEISILRSMKILTSHLQCYTSAIIARTIFHAISTVLSMKILTAYLQCNNATPVLLLLGRYSMKSVLYEVWRHSLHILQCYQCYYC